ncbi:MAG: S-layer homology domain-containing protein [Clostridia bacterium]|nr:S-layer homology domain-containing protein [Clostridia bacterium]
MKKLIAFLLITAMLFLQVSVCFAREVSTFDVLMNMDPVLLERFRAGGLSDEMIQGFMGVLDEEADKLQKPEDRETLEQYFLSLLLLYVFQQERFLPVMVAFDQEFPEEVIYIAETGRLPESLEIFFLSVMGNSIAYTPPVTEDAPDDIVEETPAPTPTPTPVPTPTPPFSDLADYPWAVEAIRYLYDNGLVEGYGDGSFHPEAPVSRAELVTLITKAFLDKTYRYDTSRFSDVSPDDWYANHLLTAEYFSIFQWIYEGEFQASAPVTRQELCAVIYRAYRRSGADTPKYVSRYEFLDNALIASYAYDPIQQLQRAGCIKGYEDGCFHPDNIATRAEAMQVIASVLQLPR